jgi:hypothetical protein
LITQFNNYLSSLSVLKKNNTIKAGSQPCLSYVFISLFNPSSIKNLTLYQRNLIKNNVSQNLRGSFRNYKILVKQSYLMSAWFYHYANKTLKSKKVRGFASLPSRQSRHTATKSPMAHKTYSQEQFIIKYYYISFRTQLGYNIGKPTLGLNETLLLVNRFMIFQGFSSTNMLVLYKIKG